MRDGVPGIDYLDDNAAEAFASFPVMSRPCSGCPSIDGTEAARHPVTSANYRECIAERHCFMCHMSPDPRDSDFKTHICAGWASAISPERAEG
jgi:hypothetical protein